MHSMELGNLSGLSSCWFTYPTTTQAGLLSYIILLKVMFGSSMKHKGKAGGIFGVGNAAVALFERATHSLFYSSSSSSMSVSAK